MIRFAKFTCASVTAISLMSAPMPASAGPDGEDLAKALAGLAVIGIIAAAANDRKDKQSANVVTIENPNARGFIGERRSPGGVQGIVRSPRAENRNILRRSFRAPLPERCQRILSTAHGDRLVYSARCLNRNFGQANRLPDRCRLLVRTNNRAFRVFGARCLRNAGWHTARF